VNVYDQDAGSSSLGIRQSALKAVTNLTTPISALKFDGSTQILAMASDSKKDQLRLVRMIGLYATNEKHEVIISFPI
jgi:U3 small nucleolar RNA-associated protein 18